jgi:hypothetical protein
MTSPRFSISKEQWVSIRAQLVKYILPLVIGFLTEIQLGKTIQEASGWLYAAALTLTINVLSKFLTESK